MNMATCYQNRQIVYMKRWAVGAELGFNNGEFATIKNPATHAYREMWDLDAESNQDAAA